MKTVQVRGLEIGSGKPKMTVPIVGQTKEEILAQADALHDLPYDLVEWRVDWFLASDDFEAVCGILSELRQRLGNTPLLMTYRTPREGGQKPIEIEDYAALNLQAAKTGLVDLVDVEAFWKEDLVREIIDEVHACGVKVIASNHDFEKTPDQDEIVCRLRYMQEIGADLCKIALMPQSVKDVLTLLAATEEMAGSYADRPIVTMSMGPYGVISRVAGETFGSALTFGSAGRASAPGQIPLEELDTVLDILHKAL